MKLNLVQERIIELFSIFVTQVRGSTAMSRTDINRLSEEVLVPLLSRLFNCPRLQNLNLAERANYPGIDLGDVDTKIAFQITSTANSEKIKDSLAKFVNHELYKTYDRLIIYILSEKQDSYSGKGFAEIIQDKFQFNKDQDIIDYRDLLKIVNSYSIDQAREIEYLLEANFGGSAASPRKRSERNEPLFFVPFERNLHFIGRNSEITAIKERFTSERLKRQVVYGMPGVGKTQIVLEYCYRHRNEYTSIVWLNSENQHMMMTSVSELARTIGVPLLNHTDHEEITRQVLNRLQEGTDSLLVFDNVEDFELLKSFPPSNFSGHVLLTTRARGVSGTGVPCEVLPLSSDEGSRLLLHRAQFASRPLAAGVGEVADRTAAKNISVEVGGLPLALDQAAAFIEEVPSTPAEYLELYRLEGKRLRTLRGGLNADHASVTITFSLAFRHLETRNRMAVDVIRLGAFLSGNEIPEEIFTIGAPSVAESFEDLGASPINLPLALREASRLSLISREPRRRVFHIHRLVQEVIKDELSEGDKRLWAERAVRSLHLVFPEPDYSVWPVCERLLPNAVEASRLIQNWQFVFYEAAELLIRIGVYCYYQGLNPDAERYYKQALSIVEKLALTEDAIAAEILNNIAVIYKRTGRYSEAESLYNEALAIQTKVFGEIHSHVGTSLNNLGSFYVAVNRFDQAESFLTKALEVRIAALGPAHIDVSETLNNLGALYKWKGDLPAAESFYRRALDIRRESLGDTNPKVATTLTGLAHVYRRQDRLAEAEPLMREALEICKKTLGLRHVNTADAFKDLAVVYNSQGRFREAKPLLMRSLIIRAETFGSDSIPVANSLNTLGYTFHHLSEFAKAETLYHRALDIRRKVHGPDHHLTYDTVNHLAELNEDKGDYDQAEQLFLKSLAGFETTLGVNHPRVAAALERLAALYIKTGKYKLAGPLLQRALDILELVPGNTDRQRSRLMQTLSQLDG